MSSAVACLSFVVFIAVCRRRREITHQPFPLARPRPAYCRLGGEHPQLADPQINARFENRRIERHAQSLRRRRRNVGHFRSMPRMPATTRGDQRKWRAGACPADRLRQQPPFRGVPLQLRAVGGREVH